MFASSLGSHLTLSKRFDASGLGARDRRQPLEDEVALVVDVAQNWALLDRVAAEYDLRARGTKTKGRSSGVNVLFYVSNHLCLFSSSALHFFRSLFSCPPPC
jgi:hypothetical protein